MSQSRELILVTWEDIVADARWLDDQEADAQEPATILSVGWLIRVGVKQGRSYLAIASCLPQDPDDKIKGSLTVIPLGVVSGVEVIG